MYKRITKTDRYKIEALYNTGHSCTYIARALGFSPSGIWHEIRHGLYEHLNSDYTTKTKYSADRAQQYTNFNRTTKGAQLKIGNDHAFLAIVEEYILKRKLSPAAALAQMKRDQVRTTTNISLRTLYSYIDKGLFPHLTNKNLPMRGIRKIRVHRKPIKRGPVGTSIEKRPSEVLSRAEFGHWEMDSVIGRQTKGETLLVFTERKTRFEMIFRAKDKSALSTVHILNRIERALGKSFPCVFRSITVDNGCEFSAVTRLETSCLANRRRTQMYYCHPYTSCERGSNENQNRLIRRFIPKGTRIESVTAADLRFIQNWMNDLPRKLHSWQTASELFECELGKLGLKKFFDKF